MLKQDIQSNFQRMIRVTKFAIFSFLSICCCFQVWVSLDKYFQGKTIIATTFVDEDKLILPVISICPGFKNLENRATISYDSLYDPFNITGDDPTEETLISFWNNSTYAIDEIFHGLKMWSSGIEVALEREKIKLGFIPEINATINEVSTVYGRCYTIQSHVKFASASYLKLFINMSSREKVLLYFHEEYAEIGLFFLYWPVSVSSRTIIKDTNSDNLLKLTVNKKIKNCISDEEYSKPKCVFNWAKQAYLNTTCNSK